jgi:hypothetical protein
VAVHHRVCVATVGGACLLIDSLTISCRPVATAAAASSYPPHSGPRSPLTQWPQSQLTVTTPQGTERYSAQGEGAVGTGGGTVPAVDTAAAAAAHSRPDRRLVWVRGAARTLMSNYRRGWAQYSEFVPCPGETERETERAPPPRFYTRREA